MRAQEAIRKGFVFSQKPEQQVLGLYIRRAELAGFIPRKKRLHAALFLYNART